MVAQSHPEFEFAKPTSAQEKAVFVGRTKVISKSYFCPNSACLTDELSGRATSSFAGVWLITDEEVGSSWLMKAEKPSCPHCGALLVASQRERVEFLLPLM